MFDGYPSSLPKAREEIEKSFRSDLLEAWYPDTVDKVYGGYLTSFDEKWNQAGNQDKFLVGQARHIWVLSELADFTGDPVYATYAEQGVTFLIESMWDSEYGGFFTLVDREGRVVVDDSKNAYGMAFAIYGLASRYAHAGDVQALEYAKKSFSWLESHAWDSEHGGYIDTMDRQGNWTAKRIDAFDTDFIGLKDYNSSIHLLECLASLYRVWPDPRVEERLREVLKLVRDRFVNNKGFLHLYFERDWSPLSLGQLPREQIVANRFFDHVSWGHDVETAFLMLEADHVLNGSFSEDTLETARSLVDHALATGWDQEEGSLFESGYYFRSEGPCEIIDTDKVWWVAGESLNATLLMAKLFPEDEKYEKAFLKQWGYIQKYLLDKEYGAWRNFGDRYEQGQQTFKAHRWKASYHDARAYMNVLKMLEDDFELIP
ncbi:AGE family epimerase/isomerase [Pelagicoccus albus]|uniref:AGE family epimerase/isomerase n=1 Tax=Pelagicoccus albus TaxID=415222 RepID=A0A7X1BAW9_9BACT|nr:AGE family epimerase/isomerase [Pelagicoccus albus]